MPKAGDLKKGMVVEINGVPHAVKQLEAKSPSSRGASTLYKIRFTNLKTSQKLDQSYKSDEMLKDADCQRLNVQYSYLDGEHYTFMNMDDFSQYSLSAADLEGQIEYLSVGLEGIVALIMDGAILAIELPPSVVMEIIETDPSIKGASATGRTKPAKMSSGLEIQVPEYLEAGAQIKINTATGGFISRA
ncbi:MAG: elongation factor P-like protein YeiP [Gammaproteobacteria bacterium]|nr:elongation factor P-like protein YeiP [Gammaproteobacteria bacterium]